MKNLVLTPNTGMLNLSITKDGGDTKTLIISGNNNEVELETLKIGQYISQKGDKGDKGDTGADGADGSGDLTYTHNQPIAATVWTIPHNLGKIPTIYAKNSAGNKLEGERNDIDLNNLTITYYFATDGNAYLN